MLIKSCPALLYLGISLIYATLTPSAYGENARLSLGAHDVVLDGLSFHYEIAGHGPLLVVQAPGWGNGSYLSPQGARSTRTTLHGVDILIRGEAGSPAVR